MMNLFPRRASPVFLLAILACAQAADPFGSLRLPSDFEGHRIAFRQPIPAGAEKIIAETDGEGCLRHIWLTYSEADVAPLGGLQLTLRIYFDGYSVPHVETPLAPFFGIHHGHAVRPIRSPFVQVTDRGSFNAYFPMPYQRGMKITLQNEGKENLSIWFLADYHLYAPGSLTEARRFRAAYRRVNRAEAYGKPHHLGHGKGRGFLAGLSLGMRVFDRRDHWYHCGGDLLLLDGGTERARLISGIGGEDFFGNAWGMDVYSNGSVGAPYYDKHPGAYEHMPIIEFAAYRFFDKDPAAFQESFYYDLGSLENDMSTVLYWYQEGTPERFVRSSGLVDRLPGAMTPDGQYDNAVSSEMTWQVAGPFPATNAAEFVRAEFPERGIDLSETHPADFGQYQEAAKRPGASPTLARWVSGVAAPYGFVDLRPHHRPRLLRNGGLPTDVSAYAASVIRAPSVGKHRLRVGHDDWLRVWINRKLVYQGDRLNGFQTREIGVDLAAGDNPILVKAANHDNTNFRAWVFLIDLLD